MSKLEFFTTSNIESKKLLQYIMDFEYYPNYFPAQITNVKIIKKENDKIFTEEKIRFSTLVKNIIEQKSIHKLLSENELMTEIIDGPAKGSMVNIFCNDTESGSDVKINVELKLSLKALFLKPLIGKFYQKYLTSLIFKITKRIESS
jgi:ribosome-associated toxin RatA of RatAB toxin-antitoxin module|tara:strand:- start:11674 stop:12114 length:441 start_codon:yes stop_codon:yes gene_type:complete